ncbi:C39 family peptidase [Staphylococcus sp. SQ8-PEA]|uniref:C39 family peptidase n=1 Tax=Staphylococcus marylandisciuri TaxID=2981529 RepID=A0ABT2QMU2_9STAP|nr:C39 family peptidase [Staphylococcus marylandisciuri]MCU5745296.1 C39 family peptidase [Staphylococcus marylandisciuri]
MSKKLLPLRPLSQLFPKPMVMGCEGVCAAMLLQYNQQQISPTHIMKYWPKHQNDPRQGYVGHQLIVKIGYHQTIFPQAFVPYLKRYNEAIQDGSGKSLEDLETLIERGQPVLIYNTVLGQKPQRKSFNFDGQKYTVTSNIHTTVLIGYDDDYYYYIDPLWSQWLKHTLTLPALFPSHHQIIRIAKSTLEESYDAPGRMCIYINKNRS